MDANNTSFTAPMVPPGLLPAYMVEAFGELYAEDGLLVLGKGLGLLQLLAAFARYYSDVEEGYAADTNYYDNEIIQQTNNNKANSSVRPPLVFVLGLKDNDERQALLTILESWGTPPHLLPTMITNESGQGKDRAGRCIFSRTLLYEGIR